MKNESKNMYLNWLYHVPGIGRKKLEYILGGGKDAKWLYLAKSEEVEAYLRKVYRSAAIHEKNAVADIGRIEEAKKNISPEKLQDSLERQQIQCLFRKDEEYPERLREIPDSPIVLYCKGSNKIRGITPVVAVVGTRNCSSYGSFVAKRIGELCAEMGIGLVSGMASGIDGISQWYAVKNDGDVTAVLGSGVDVCYPWENKGLYDALLEKGRIYSEYIPGTQPKAQYFPPRNRIISGLADAVIVVEAKEKSGTLITVDMALEQGKDVYVVPGRLTDPMSLGCNKLVSQGAEIIVDLGKTLLEICEKKSLHNKAKKAEKKENIVAGKKTKLDIVVKEEKDGLHNNKTSTEDISTKILNILDLEPQTVQQIYEKLLPGEAECDIRWLQQKLIRLELEGIISENGGRFLKKPVFF